MRPIRRQRSNPTRDGRDKEYLFKWLSTSGVLLFHSSVFDLSQLMLSNCGQFSALSPVPAIGRPDVIVENEDVISIAMGVESMCIGTSLKFAQSVGRMC